MMAMKSTVSEDEKFQGGVHYYHRHSDGSAESPPAGDWMESHHQRVRLRRRRRLKLLGLTLVVLAIVAGTFFFLID